jgi:crotonobetainyl-CoA:carnitine CoA-transferase CaiB-like acyl-CoA transferase
VTHGAGGALAGVVVVDLSRVLAGPYAAMMLGDYGATVIKVEEPERGDDTRRWGPPFTASGESAYYLAVNRNKLGLAVDMRQAAGRAVVDGLLEQADILIENYKPATRAAFALTPDAVGFRHPRLVHVAISGFGASGPFAARPGYDSVAQAASGLMSITGAPDGEPAKCGVAISDLAAGFHACFASLAALRHRDRTGRGQFIDVSLFDASLGLLANVASSVLVSGRAPERWGNAHASIVPYDVVAAKDRPFMLAVGNDGQFRALAQCLGASWADDARFATNPARVEHRAALMSLLAERFSREIADVWLARLERAGVPAGPLRTVPEALASDEAKARGMVAESGGIPMVGPAAKLGLTPARVGSPPPKLGEHTDEILRGRLGYDAGRIAALRREGIVA